MLGKMRTRRWTSSRVIPRSKTCEGRAFKNGVHEHSQEDMYSSMVRSRSLNQATAITHSLSYKETRTRYSSYRQTHMQYIKSHDFVKQEGGGTEPHHGS